MFKRVLIFLSVFGCFILIFLAGKGFFIAYNYNLYKGIDLGDLTRIFLHGLPLDVSMSGYFSILPGIFLILSVWLKNKIVSICFASYFAIIGIFISMISITDAALFSFWDFHFDSNILFYLKNVKDSFASVSFGYIIIGSAVMITCVGLIMLGYKFFINKQIIRLSPPKSPCISAGVLFLLTGLSVILGRGGFTESGMNPGKAHFGANIRHNQAAVNSCYNFLYSLFRSDNYSSQYYFMEDEKAVDIFHSQSDKPATDDIPQLLNDLRPNIILFVLESFGAAVVEPLGGTKGITPNLTKFCEEGILFENYYANSFRTDRGLVSILSGYPAQAAVSIMKYPQKMRTLPAIPEVLGKTGYSRELFYGGDIDFANMRFYFSESCKMERIVSTSDFPQKDKKTQWGVPDHILLDTFTKYMQENDLPQPFFKMILTLSSHEPFEVQFNKFEEPYLNSIAYADSCLGDFMEKFKKTPYWNNTLIILLADHTLGYYPPGIELYAPKRYHIPMIWTGGAVKQPTVIKQVGSQADLAATLLSQLKMEHKDFIFSKNILNPTSPHFAFYSYVNGFGLVNAEGNVVYDKDADRTFIKDSPEADSLLLIGKVYLQYLYRDLDKR